MQRINLYSLILIIQCLHFIWILSVVAVKGPKQPSQGRSLGSSTRVESNYNNKDSCPPPDPNVSSDGTIPNQDPNVNDGLPYYPCNYTFGGYEGQFFLADGTYYPCVKPRVISVLRVGGNLPEGVTIRKGVHQNIAVKFPAKKDNKIPLVAAVVTEGVILVTNVSTPYQWRKNIRFNEAKKEKVAQRRKDTTPFSASQVQLAKSLFSTLTSLVDNAERHMVSINLNNRDDKKFLGPFIATDIQTFSTPSIRALEELFDEDEDTIETQSVFGFAGSRFEFDEPKAMAQKIKELISSSEVPTVNLGNLGTNPMESSRNTLAMFNKILEISRDAHNTISRILTDETERINEDSEFTFGIPPVQTAYCNRTIEVDPWGVNSGGNLWHTVGMGSVSRPRRS